MTFSCPSCSAKYAVSPDLSDRVISCRRCGERARVPFPDVEQEKGQTPAYLAAAVEAARVLYALAVGLAGIVFLLAVVVALQTDTAAAFLGGLVGAKLVLHLTQVATHYVRSVAAIDRKHQ